MKKGILMFAILIMAMTLAVPNIASAFSPTDLTAPPLGAYTGSDWTENPPTSLVGLAEIQITNPTELAKLYSADDDWLCNSTVDWYSFHRFVFEIPSCVTHISMLHEGYGNGTGGHALHVWNGSGWEDVDDNVPGGPPDRQLTGELTSDFSNYVQNGELNLLAIASDQGDEICTDYVRVGYTPCAVGGEVLPIDKVSILAPWLALGTLMAVAMAVLVIMKRRRLA